MQVLYVCGAVLGGLFSAIAFERQYTYELLQVMYVCGAVLGGLFSALASDSVATTPGVTVDSAVCGGVLMLLGARLGAGCTRWVFRIEVSL